MSRKLRGDDPRHPSLTGTVLGRNIDLSVRSGASLLDFNLTWKQNGLVLTTTEKAGLDQDTTALLHNNDVWTATLFVKVGSSGRWTKLGGNLRTGEVLIQPSCGIASGTKISLKLKKRGLSTVINNLVVPVKE